MALAGEQHQSPFGDRLREWRALRAQSQLDLSFTAGISQRHISFLETGRARPSRDSVLILAEALDVPLRERNVLLHLAGFAPLYQERSLDDESMAAVRGALEVALKHHEPYPALVVDGCWRLLMANEACLGFFSLFVDPATVWGHLGGAEPNVMRLCMHPRGLRQYCNNWEDMAYAILARARRELISDPSRTELQELIEEVLTYDGVPTRIRIPDWQRTPPPVLCTEFQKGPVRASLMSIISTFGTPQETNLQDLRIEAFYPADKETEALFQRLRSTGS